MNGLIRHDIDECADNAERARWLLTASIDCLVRERSFIQLVLRQCGFQEGLQYLEAELANFRAARTDDGEPVDFVAIKVARGRMDRIACGLPPRRLGA